MTFFIQVMGAYLPIFKTYVFPFIGLYIILYTIYLIQYLFFGRT